jgi:hypothetical protein
VSSGAPALHYANFSAPAFTPVQKSSHNGTDTTVCGSTVEHSNMAPLDLGEERTSDLNAIKGSYLENVRLPDGATVRKLSLFVNDFDSEDAHVYLVRKLIQAGLTPRFTGYKVLAHTASSGAVDDKMRKFTDSTINKPVIDNERFFYFLELVNCGVTEPFDVQIAFNS